MADAAPVAVDLDAAVCRVCGFVAKNRNGMLIHFGRTHREKSSSPTPLVATSIAWLRRVAGKDAVADVDRLLSSQAEWPPDSCVVVGEDAGPWVCRRDAVGRVVSSTRGVCVVLPLQVAVDAVEREKWREESEAQRSKRQRKAAV